MSNAAAQLSNLLALKADYNFYVEQQIYWSNREKANTEKLTVQTKYEEKWEAAYDTAKDGGRTKALKMDGNVFLDKEVAGTDAQAKQWADYDVDEYDAELKVELAELDVEYDTMVTMYDALCEQTKALIEAAEQSQSNADQDTGLLGN